VAPEPVAREAAKLLARRRERKLLVPWQSLERQLEPQGIPFRHTPALGQEAQRTAAPRVPCTTAGVVGRNPGRDVERDTDVQRPVGALGDVDEPGHNERQRTYFPLTTREA
jgi:hypothetical protein